MTSRCFRVACHAGLVGVCAIVLGACQSQSPPGSEEAGAPVEEEPLLYVYNWNEYIGGNTIQAFERASGIKVVYDTYDSNEALIEKLKTERYDLVFPTSRPWAHRHIAESRFHKLDKSKLDGLGSLDADLMRGLRDIDPNNAHVIPYLWGTTGIAFDPDKVADVLGERVPIDSWAFLFEPEKVAKLSACGVVIVDDMTDVMSSALIFRGADLTAPGDAEARLAESTLMPIRPYVRVLDSDVFDDAIAEGEACVVLGYSGDLLRAKATARAAGRQVEYLVPKEGAIRWVDVMAIPASAPHPVNAHRMINDMLKPEVIAAISNELHYANANVDSWPLLDADLRSDPGVFPPPEVKARLVDPPILDSDRRAVWKAAWQEFKAAPAANAN